MPTATEASEASEHDMFLKTATRRSQIEMAPLSQGAWILRPRTSPIMVFAFRPQWLAWAPCRFQESIGKYLFEHRVKTQMAEWQCVGDVKQ